MENNFNDSKIPIHLTTCAICGKQFVKAPLSIYKVTYNGRINQCCSYSCYQKAKKLKEDLHNEANYKKFSDKIKER